MNKVTLKFKGSRMECFQTLCACLSSNRTILLILMVMTALLGVAYPLGYLFEYVVPNASNLSILSFWWCGLLTLVTIIIIIFGIGVIIAFIVQGIILAAKYCSDEWNRAKQNLHTVQNAINESESLIH